jgi:hypothetical protein
VEASSPEVNYCKKIFLIKDNLTTLHILAITSVPIPIFPVATTATNSNSLLLFDTQVASAEPSGSIFGQTSARGGIFPGGKLLFKKTNF